MTALSLSPSEFWSGIDGEWSTFVLNIGTPSTAVNVLISTSDSISYTVLPQGCENGAANTTCEDARGRFYDPGKSSTWNFKGTYALDVEAPLGWVKDSAQSRIGFDVVSAGYQGGGGPTVNNQTIATFFTGDFWLGLFGIQPLSFNISGAAPIPSFLQMLKDENRTASLSWGYTAGATYQLNQVAGSLIASGYDSSKFIPNDVTFPMNQQDSRRYMTVNVQSIGISGSQGATPNVLDSSIPMFIDSDLPYMWLPQDVCDRFEDKFNLTYDDDSGLYLVSNSSHSALRASNPSVTFTLSTEASGGDSLQITLPYAAFDLLAQPPLLPNSSYYFPIRVAANESQYALGRTFLQEAYIIADFERMNFSVSQAQFLSGASANLVTITSPSQTPSVTAQPSGSSGISAGAIAGIVIGVLAALAIIAGATFWFWWRPRRARQRAANAEKPISSDDDNPPQYSAAAYDQTRQQIERQPDENVSEMPGEGLPHTTKNRGELEGIDSPRLRGYYGPEPEAAEVEGNQPHELGTRDSKQEYVRSGEQPPQRPEPERHISHIELPSTVSRNNSQRVADSDNRDSRASVVNPAEAESHPVPIRDDAVSPASDHVGTFLASPVDSAAGERNEFRSDVSQSPAVSPVTNPTLLGSPDTRRLSFS